MNSRLWSFCLPAVVGGEVVGGKLAVEAVAACILRIPSAPQCPEGGNGGARSFGLRLRLRVLHLQQVAVGVEDLDQADDAALVGGKRVLARAGERRFTLR